MCYGCWCEADKPSRLPSTGELCAKLIDLLYEQPEGGAGGNLHIVTDDWNLEDDNIAFCQRLAISAIMGQTDSEYTYVAPEQNAVELAICLLMGAMTEDERHATMAFPSGYIDAAGIELVAA